MNKQKEKIKYLKEKRNEYGVSQNKLAITSGISRAYLCKVENGKVNPSDDILDSLIKSLDKLNPNAPLDLMFDYVRVRFPTLNVHEIVEQVLALKFEYMAHENYGFYSYSEHYHYGDIFILTSQELEKGILIELKGKGCRQFESFLLAQGRSWYDFFMDCIIHKAVFKRIDIAINDKADILDLKELSKKAINGECISSFRSFNNVRSGELKTRHEKEDMGNTLYIGSLKSEVYFCIYQKDYEQYIKQNIPLEDAIIKNRFEIRLKNERAEKAIYDLLTHYDVEKTAFSIINRYLKFVDKEDDKRKADWKLNSKWDFFIGNNREALKLTSEPEPYTLERTLKWLKHQVAPTLKTLQEVDTILDKKMLPKIINEAKLSDKHKTLIAQLTTPIESVISKKKEE